MGFGYGGWLFCSYYFVVSCYVAYLTEHKLIRANHANARTVIAVT